MATGRAKTAPLIKEVLLDAPANKVWQAITDKNKMKEWYFDLQDFEPVVGNEFHFVAQDQDCKDFVHLCKVIEVTSGKKLAYTWRYKGYEGDSVVSWELFAEGDKTKLVLTHTGLDTFPADSFFDVSNFQQGWSQLLDDNLVKYLSRND